MKKITSLILAAFLLLAPMTAFSADDDGGQNAELFAPMPGYEFMFHKTAEIYVGGKRVNSKPNGAFSVKWNVVAQSSESTGTIYATLYEKITVGATEVLIPLEIKTAAVSNMPTSTDYSNVNKPETVFENLNPDRAYIVKAVLLDDNFNPCACSYMPGEGFNCTYFTFDLNDAGSYGDGDGF